MTDNQTVADLQVMPKTRRLIGEAGVTFANSFVSYPMCCPSRTTYFTDPNELHNGQDDPAYASIRGELAQRLARLETCQGTSCRWDITYPVPSRLADSFGGQRGGPADQRISSRP